MIKNYSLFFIAFLCFSLFGYGQITENFESGQSTSGYSTSQTLSSGTWTGSNALLRSNNKKAGDYSCQIKKNSSNFVATPSLNTCGIITFWYRGGTPTVKKTTGGITTTLTSTVGTTSVNQFYEYTVIVNDASSDIVISIYNSNSTSYLDEFSATTYSTTPTTPTITAVPTTITGLDYELGSGPSSTQSFDVTGTNLTGSITVTAPTNFSIATTSGGTYGASATIPAASANGTTTLYTILNSGLAINTYSGNATISSTGSTDITAAFSGEVTDVYVGPCGSETFTIATLPTSYSDGNFTGDNSVIWTFEESRNDAGYEINGEGIMLRKNTSKLTSSSISGGIGNFSCKLLKAYTGSGNRQVELFVNGVSQGTSVAWDNTTIQTFTVSGINIGGNVIVEIRNITGKQVIVDDIEWTCYTACSAPADPTGSITGTTPACTSTELTYTGTAAPGITNYWQTSATGTATTDNATGTYIATTSGTYYVRAYDTSGTCWSDNAVSYNVVIEDGIPTLTQPTNQTEEIPDTATFSVSSSNTDTYQWQVSTNGGSTWTNVTGGSGATTDTYTSAATTTAMDGNQYRCILTNICGTTTSDAATLSLYNDSPNNATGLEACIGETSIDLSWNASSGALTPTGYIVFAKPGSTAPTSTATAAGDASGYTTNTNYTLATTYGTLGKALYKGTNTNATITSLTSGNDYTFKVVAYYSEDLTGWSASINNSGSWNDTYTIGIPEATFTNASIAQTSSVLSWTNPLPTSCYELLIVANQGSITSFTPTNGSTYSANATYSGANSIVFAGNGITTTINGLTDTLEYCYTIFVRNTNTGEWSSGTSICQTTGLSYCESSGETSSTGILNVTLNTINETSASSPAYTDFTSISTNLTLGETYPLSVNVNTGGNYTSYVKVWIDWNRDGSFNNSGNEAIELGTLNNNSNGQSSFSPINITVPSNAEIGTLRMRVSSRSISWDPDYATPCEDFNYGEVEDYTIITQQATNAEINIKANNISILNGFDAPYSLNNTLFAAREVTTTSAPKTYTIQNIGLTTLNLTGTPKVEITGLNSGDFAVSTQPSAVNITPNGELDFQITFTPTGIGTRTATVSIANSDPTGGENPYTFTIEGTGECPTPTLTMSPNNGPIGTIVSITSPISNFDATTTATIAGFTAPVTLISANEIEVTIPSGANTASIIISDNLSCPINSPSFNVINNTGNCGGLTDLIISEIYDANSGDLGYIEIYNGTNSIIDLSSYNIKRYGDLTATTSTVTYNFPTSGIGSTIASGAVLVGYVGSSANASIYDFPLGASGFNADDRLELYNDTILIDDWHDDSVSGGTGFSYIRKTTITSGNPNFDLSEWSASSSESTSNLGTYNYPIVSSAPTATAITDASDCAILDYSITATEGDTDTTGDLTYQWYYNNGLNNTWTAVSSASPSGYTILGEDGNNLLIEGDANPLSNLTTYQFYCEVKEAGSCTDASNAIKPTNNSVIWDGSNWSTILTSNSAVILNGNYDTSIQGSFSACSLIVNTGNTLVIEANTFVEITNNVDVHGNITIEDKGSFVQLGDGSAAGTFTLHSGATTQVNKKTAELNNWYEYTYWSSPVENETIGNGLAEAHPTRRFWYNAQNYKDTTKETDNNNAAEDGQDDIDDNGDDWQYTNNGDTMITGMGYAATHNPSGFTAGLHQYTFEGPLHTGDYEISIYRNDSEPDDNNWNLIGNPYASAIDADDFLTANTVIDVNVSETTTGTTDGAIFFWSQDTPYSGTNNGSEGLNFAQSDYAVINGTGQTAGGDGIEPDRFIPSGQAFFISMSDTATPTSTSGDIKTANVTFTNSMRVTGNNTQFFRTETTEDTNKLWLNLNSDNGAFNQTLIGYVQGATSGYDGMYYDALKNFAMEAYTSLYSVIDNVENENKFAIQGKAIEDLNLNEVIPLGFSTSINESTIYTLSIHKLQGEFLTNNTTYLHDILLNVYHNLNASNYTFTSETGTFNERFEIVFTPTTLSVDDNFVNVNNITITELQNGNVEFRVGNPHTIKHVDIIDVTGRVIYNLQGNNAIEVYDLSKLSQAAYIAKITLSNGQVISKKAIKQK
ncbi:GEVED domain-containing protein [Winogradskyella undariae]|uniref:GEVED domain-containing protein n=1 Tax=Winogradskyella undariae TaxID=1285465 RepID=UPI0015C7D05C|nr:GEVED domain-containing protein [Winogradskyella undariae]